MLHVSYAGTRLPRTAAICSARLRALRWEPQVPEPLPPARPARTERGSTQPAAGGAPGPLHRACAEPSLAAPCRRSRTRPTVAVWPLEAHRPAASPRDGGANDRRTPPAFPLRCPPLPPPPVPRSGAKEEPRLSSGSSQSERRTLVPPPTSRPLRAPRGTNARADWLRRALLAARPPKAKKNDGSTEAQKARGKTASRPQANRGPIPPRAAPARVRGGRPPRASERGGETAACQPAELTAWGEPSASACGDLGHKWRAVDSPRCVTTQGQGGGGSPAHVTRRRGGNRRGVRREGCLVAERAR